MSKNYEDLFKQLKEVEPSLGLGQKINYSILAEQKRQTKVRFVIMSCISIISLLVSIPVLSELVSNITKTGLYEYASLILSDSPTLMSYWKEFTLSIVESIPLFGTIIFLSIVSVFLWSSAKAIRTARFVLSTT